MRTKCVSLVAVLVCCLSLHAAEPKPSREQVVDAMRPYGGLFTQPVAAEAAKADGVKTDSQPVAKNSASAGAATVDRSTLTGKIMAGYQGWFCCQGDGAGLGWKHYQARGGFQPGKCTIDLWPDTRELADDEKFATPFQSAAGETEYVYSADNPKTVLRHFQWMQQYGIDGVFVQRFVVETRDALNLRHFNNVLNYCRHGANEYGRTYAVMYDLSGLRAGGTQECIDDWKLLVDKMKLGRDEHDKAYLHHQGKPVVAVWGIGFNDHRAYALEECAALIDFLKNDPDYGGNTVLVGVPTGWRTLNRDCVSDPALHELILKADIVCPWTVGRYSTLAQIDEHAEKVLKPDIAWCHEHGKEYLPVTFPGFSWHNMNPKSPLDQIPRLKGEFLWRQYADFKTAGATMLYQAMFDEMDEGTAIFKVTKDPPVGESSFVTYEGLPSDQYLWLCGQGAALLRGELPDAKTVPLRKTESEAKAEGGIRKAE